MAVVVGVFVIFTSDSCDRYRDCAREYWVITIGVLRCIAVVKISTISSLLGVGGLWGDLASISFWAVRGDWCWCHLYS